MEKDFIPYKQALVLKELGFDEECFSYIKHLNYYYKKDKIQILSRSTINQLENDGLYLLKIPLYQQAFIWFRKKYNLNNFIYHYKKEEVINFAYNINDNIFEHDFKTYEEAEFECLKKLIEIIKNKYETSIN